MKKILFWICRFVPTHVSNKLLLFVLQLMRVFQSNGNMFAMQSGDKTWDEEGYIENQHSMNQIYMGMATMAEAGCEVIASYNALLSLGRRIPLADLIHDYEKDGIIHSGKFGVAPKAIADRLRKLGCELKTFVPGKKNRDIDGFASDYRTLILTYYNDGRDLMKQIHTIAITKEEEGYVGHNAFCNGRVTKPFASLSELLAAITSGFGSPIMLIGIENIK